MEKIIKKYDSNTLRVLLLKGEDELDKMVMLSILALKPYLNYEKVQDDEDNMFLLLILDPKINIEVRNILISILKRSIDNNMFEEEKEKFIKFFLKLKSEIEQQGFDNNHVLHYKNIYCYFPEILVVLDHLDDFLGNGANRQIEYRKDLVLALDSLISNFENI